MRAARSLGTQRCVGDTALVICLGRSPRSVREVRIDDVASCRQQSWARAQLHAIRALVTCTDVSLAGVSLAAVGRCCSTHARRQLWHLLSDVTGDTAGFNAMRTR
jgi:hypothetical protein